ncbi:MAG: aspartate dehydrogenase [Faecousia sp.]
MFRRKEKQGTYDRESLKPVIRSSICTGEQTAGFKNLHTGKFSEVMLIRSSRDLEEFQRTYGIADGEITTEY